LNKQWDSLFTADNSHLMKKSFVLTKIIGFGQLKNVQKLQKLTFFRSLDFENSLGTECCIA
jgi:hypothetical protein